MRDHHLGPVLQQEFAQGPRHPRLDSAAAADHVDAHALGAQRLAERPDVVQADHRLRHLGPGCHHEVADQHLGTADRHAVQYVDDPHDTGSITARAANQRPARNLDFGLGAPVSGLRASGPIGECIQELFQAADRLGIPRLHWLRVVSARDRSPGARSLEPGA